MNKTSLISEIHSTNREWLNLISFYQDELMVMERRIAEVVAKNTAVEVLANVERYQNQVIIFNPYLIICETDDSNLRESVSLKETAKLCNWNLTDFL